MSIIMPTAEFLQVLHRHHVAAAYKLFLFAGPDSKAAAVLALLVPAILCRGHGFSDHCVASADLTMSSDVGAL